MTTLRAAMPLTAFLLALATSVAMSACHRHARDASDEADCPDGAQWDGVRCVRTEVACPDGSSWEEGKCVAEGSSPGGSALGAGPSLAGTWVVTGARPDGAQYSGNAVIVKGAAGTYKITWSIGSASYDGLAVRRGDVVSVGWADAIAKDYGVVDFAAKGDGKLEGSWWDAGRPSGPGRELLSGGTPSLAGVYTIDQGVGPDGTSYGGTLDLAVTGELHTLMWHVGKDTFRGLGIRTGELLSVGFATDPKANFGVVQYIAQGDTLEGRWAEWSQKTAALGTERLVRKD